MERKHSDQVPDTVTGRILFIAHLLCAFLITTDTWAEAFQFTCTVDRDSVTVGDRIVLTLELRRPLDDTSAVAPELSLPEVFQILHSPRATSTREDESQLIAQSIELAAFKTGLFTLPAAVVQLIRSPGDTLRLSADPIDIVVGSVKPVDIDDIMDIRPPVDIDARIPWWGWVGLCLLVVILLVVVWLLFLRKKKTRPEPPLPPTDWFEEIRRIGRSGLLEAGDLLTYYTSLSETLRRFLEARTGVEAMERTTIEVGDDLSTAGIGSGRVIAIQGFLSEADLVKFAKFLPGADKAREDLNRVLHTMGEVDTDLRPIVEPQPFDEEIRPS